jgi:hypothetical protein
MKRWLDTADPELPRAAMAGAPARTTRREPAWERPPLPAGDRNRRAWHA